MPKASSVVESVTQQSRHLCKEFHRLGPSIETPEGHVSSDCRQV